MLLASQSSSEGASLDYTVSGIPPSPVVAGTLTSSFYEIRKKISE